MQNTEAFNNDQVHPAQIPTIEMVDMNGIDSAQLRIDYIYAVLFWTVIACIAIAVFYFVEDYPSWVLISVVIVLVSLSIFSFVMVNASYKAVKYALREHDILFEEGVFWRSKVAVPFNRIQHAEVHQNPFERKHDLSRLKIYTAGGSSSDVSVHGLRTALANGMKSFILSKVVQNEEE